MGGGSADSPTVVVKESGGSGMQGPEELFETTSQCLLSGQDRDALAGWGAIIYVV